MKDENQICRKLNLTKKSKCVECHLISTHGDVCLKFVNCYLKIKLAEVKKQDSPTIKTWLILNLYSSLLPFCVDVP